LNFNPADRSKSCLRGDAEAKISEADNEIVMKIFSIAVSATTLSQIKENLSIANYV
jgi:hypothetical protein